MQIWNNLDQGLKDTLLTVFKAGRVVLGVAVVGYWVLYNLANLYRPQYLFLLNIGLYVVFRLYPTGHSLVTGLWTGDTDKISKAAAKLVSVIAIMIIMVLAYHFVQSYSVGVSADRMQAFSSGFTAAIQGKQ